MNLFVYRKNLFDEGEGTSSKKIKILENEDSPEKEDDTRNVLDNDKSKKIEPKTKPKKCSIESYLKKQEFSVVNPKNANTESTFHSKMIESEQDNLESNDTKEKDDLKCPADYDPEVWNNLPIELKQELLATNEPTTSNVTKVTRSENDTVDNHEDNVINNNRPEKEPEENTVSDTEECPEGVDKQVFEQLPKEIRSELSKSMSKKTPSSKNHQKPQGSSSKASKHNKVNKKDTGSKSHSILSFFSRQK